MPREHRVLQFLLILAFVNNALSSYFFADTFIRKHCSNETIMFDDLSFRCTDFLLTEGDLSDISENITSRTHMKFVNCDIDEFNGKVLNKLSSQLYYLEIYDCTIVLEDSEEIAVNLETLRLKNNEITGSLTSLIQALPLLSSFFCVGCEFALSDRLTSKTLEVFKVKDCKIGLSQNKFSKANVLKALTLDNCGIQDIPESTFKGVEVLTVLSLVKNQLTYLSRSWLKDLNTLESLDLRNNQLNTIETNVFQDLRSLRELFLSGNKLKTLEKDCFKGLLSLQNLDLSSNKFEELESGSFEGLEAISELDLSLNHLKVLKDGCFDGMVSILIIHLSSNKLEVWNSKAFSSPSSLESLYLKNNNLKTLGTDAFVNFKKLVNLELSENNLDRVESFRDLRALENLNLSSNYFHEININGLRAIVSLDLSFNNLTIFQNLNRLRKLEEVYLQNNKLNLTDFQSKFLPLSIEKVDLSNNEFVLCDRCDERWFEVVITDNTSVMKFDQKCVEGENIICDSVKFSVEWEL